MYSYLNSSVDFGGIANGTGVGYLTISVATSDNYDAWSVCFSGDFPRVNSNDSTAAGACDVIEVNKFDR